MPSTDLRSPSDRRRWLARLALAVIAGALVAAFLSALIGTPARRALFDAYQRTAPRSVAADRVAVVVIDPESLAVVGGWPWPRYYLARLTEKIAEGQPKAIGFDMIFPEEDRLNPDQFAELYPELSDVDRAALRQLPSMDSLFAQTIGAAPILLGRLAIDGDGNAPDQLLLDPEIAGMPPRTLNSAAEVLTSIASLDDVALAHALLNGPPDPDGIVRRVPAAIRTGKRAMPGLAVEMARIADGEPALAWSGADLRLGKAIIPLDRDGNVRLWFGDFPRAATFSAARVLAGAVPADRFTGKVVLVGLGAEGTADLVATPASPAGYGVFVQAQAIDSLLNGDWLERPRWALAAEWAAGIFLVLIVVLAAVHRRRWMSIGAVLLLALPLASWFAFTGARLLLDPIRPAMLAAGAALAYQTMMFARARAERTRLAAALVDERVSSAKQEGELAAARTIQLGMVPGADKLAKIDPRFDVGGILDPARSVGGDFYDAARLNDGRLLLVIGDVTGKGVPAALYMALSKGLAKSMLTRSEVGLGDAVATLNRELLHDGDETMGVTMLLAILDATSGKVEMVCAGHENPIIVGTNGTARSLPLRGGPPFCVIDFPYQTETASLEPGETLVMITDGVTEAQNADGALLGVDGALAAVALGADDASGLALRVRDTVRAFEGETDPSDDLTVLVATRRP